MKIKNMSALYRISGGLVLSILSLTACSEFSSSEPPTVNSTSTISCSSESPCIVKLVWRDNSSNEDGFTLERTIVERNEPFTALATVGTDVQSYEDLDIVPGLTFCYRAYAFNSGGKSGYSNVACGQVVDSKVVHLTVR